MTKEPTKMTSQNSTNSSEPKQAHQHSNVDDHIRSQRTQSNTQIPSFENHGLDKEETALQRQFPAPENATKEPVTSEELLEEYGRERLKRHRVEVAGLVWIPDIWGQEELLKDWIDCSAFDASLVPNGIMSARAALAEEGRRANSGGLRIENRC